MEADCWVLAVEVLSLSLEHAASEMKLTATKQQRIRFFMPSVGRVCAKKANTILVADSERLPA
jgi:hypothetical protein